MKVAASTLVEWAKLLPVVPAYHMDVDSRPFLIELSVMISEISGRCPQCLDPCSYLGNLEEAAGSALAIWKVKQQVDDTSL